ncbi:LysR family transcriptional regulator [Pseudomonas thivervalensis]|jgi:DNA-binding transcriptional LysR family regulator|uniref:LysR family transcriptional regulator n=1 Tax=Pseudomonas thivervalensis TaxID=86265 RepID=A0A176NFF7_9PSED|nr:LysR family transcriptional regulator [Pseudomonas thivervalensis]AXA53761.1 LysR family transcriptional regulator [Pseudomonas thivervalensis]AXA59349.1 LysR family transcriptional regulator [Pseudomonas thivervalensis]OAB49880.1 LysR family transcriptional regulator [Pseudomonas thivervalensis]SDF55128.1 DNA-binding transcriptional regulator, LysR family [Pseudomonas thivervalensis]
MISIEDLRLAVTLARSESLSAAARTLNVSPPALSMRLRKLEVRLGLTLANRDARRLSLTADGERFSRESARLLEQLEALPESFKQQDEQLVGTLRLAAPFGYGRQRIAPLLARFAKLHPQLCLHLDLRETPWPDRHDSDAVIHIGHLNDSQWVARLLTPNDRWLCASPVYLEHHGTPSSPEQLAEHRCICIRENDEDVTLWHLRKGQGRKTLRIEPAMLSNDGSVARRWAEQGLGLVLRSQWDVSDAIADNRLVRVLADWQFDSASINLLVPSRKLRSPRVQVLVAFLEEALKG